jgi:hypothetical protein
LEDKLLVNDERRRWRGCALFKLLSMGASALSEAENQVALN